MGDITRLLHSARAGETGAVADLFAQLYPELRRIARQRLARDERGTLLDTTALVHECYLKFAAAQRLRVEDRVLGYDSVQEQNVGGGGIDLVVAQGLWCVEGHRAPNVIE